ncbi:hypothetical protein [Limnohabitans sp. Jir72]|uniref:hypothetical protein n=1 Tax=Limnohabitans sp. Jir72 TaxID=1977909 RepID=UPI000D3622A5|nr:hypothetical protein [Limnohabitans sp. Jir72]PUE35620.1 hypothetical protein B9Z52_00040 [Limnohabitans sp. Jir72]
MKLGIEPRHLQGTGHWLHHPRNGQQQVTGLTLSPVQRPWLRTLAPERTIATNLRRDLAGLAHLQAGNSITTDWQRSYDASLARTEQRLMAQQVQQGQGFTQPQSELHQGITAIRFDKQGRQTAGQAC